MSFITLQNEVYKLQSEDLNLQAVELVTSEISTRPGSHELYNLRSQSLLKLEKFKEAASDAGKAIELGASSDAHMVHGKALFNLGKFVESLDTFTKGREKAGPDLDRFDQFGQWMAWCEERIKKLGLGDISPNMADNTEKNTNVTTESPPNVMPVPKIKHDWYQTETHVIITILIKNQKKEDIKVDFTEKTISVTAPLPGGSEYSLELDLCHPVNPTECSFRVVPSKVEVKMKKVDCIRWDVLEGDGSEPIVKATPTGASTKDSGPAYPSSASRKHDWNKIEADIKAEEEDEKLEGDAALNQLFQKIYGQGSDETKRAMNKSFMESGGTVLSTNWKEVSTDKVDVKPPDGMEYKKWNE